MRSLEVYRRQLQRAALRPLATGTDQRIWEADMALIGQENEAQRLPLVAANVAVSGVFVFGISSFFSSDTF